VLWLFVFHGLLAGLEASMGAGGCDLVFFAILTARMGAYGCDRVVLFLRMSHSGSVHLLDLVLGCSHCIMFNQVLTLHWCL
jgi:hypothetical protein